MHGITTEALLIGNENVCWQRGLNTNMLRRGLTYGDAQKNEVLCVTLCQNLDVQGFLCPFLKLEDDFYG